MFCHTPGLAFSHSSSSEEGSPKLMLGVGYMLRSFMLHCYTLVQSDHAPVTPFFAGDNSCLSTAYASTLCDWALKEGMDVQTGWVFCVCFWSLTVSPEKGFNIYYMRKVVKCALACERV